MKKVLIVYDITSDRRRNRVFKLLKNNATRVQYSVFEGYLADEPLNNLKQKLVKLINPKQDSVMIIYVCGHCQDRTERIGNTPHPTGQGDIVI